MENICMFLNKKIHLRKEGLIAIRIVKKEDGRYFVLKIA